MDWKTPYTSTKKTVFREWLRRTHGEKFAAEYENNDDPEFKHHSDPDHYPRKYTRNDQPLHPKGA